jgi:hypothetical protein
MPGQEGDDVTRGVPVLRPTIQQEHRLAFTRFGDAHAQPRQRSDEAVTDAVHM